MKLEKTNKSKRAYSKPKLEVVKIDNQITTFMMSLPPDPGPIGMNSNPQIDSNPFKINKA